MYNLYKALVYGDPFGSMRDPVLESSTDCKQAASINIGTNATHLQSVLETKRGRTYYQTGRAA